MKDSGLIFSLLACKASKRPRDLLSVSVLQFLVAIRVTQRGRRAEITGRFRSAVYSLGFCSMQFEMAQATEGIQALMFWQGVKQTLAEVL